MADLQAQVDALVRQIKINRGDIDSLERRADVAEIRADAAELRADEVSRRADALEAQVAMDREMIAELQRDGVLSQEHAAQMEQAMRSSRTVGAAIGLLMASRQVSDTEAFDILKAVSQKSNRKLRELAADIVASPASIEVA